MALTKNHLIDMLYNHIGGSRNECSQALDTCFEIIKDELSNGRDVRISGFGKWVVRNKRPRLGRNPQNGEAMTISERRVVTFKCSQKLRAAIDDEETAKL